MKDNLEGDREQENKHRHQEEHDSRGFPGSLLVSAAEGVGKLAGRAQALDLGKQFESAKQAVEQSVEKVRSTEIGKHLASTRDTVSESFDKLSGAQFREEFERFSDAVTKVILGIHRDQAELRAQLGRLDKRVTELQADLRKQDRSQK
jgi:hypothetical protein